MAAGSAAKGKEPKKSPSTTPKAKANGNSNGSGTQSRSGGAIEALKADHRKAEQLFARYEMAKDSEKRSIIEEVCKALTLHTLLEEEVFYPACREEIDEADPLD
ncbi:MAG: hemerythrin domain-containing protein, partial [Novosphingobium sp.]